MLADSSIGWLNAKGIYSAHVVAAISIHALEDLKLQDLAETCHKCKEISNGAWMQLIQL
jgi:hypothetical protein